MAITNNVDLVVTYDTNQLVASARILPSTDPQTKEHAAQCVAIETLRTLMAEGLTVQQYNDLTTEAWQALINESVERASLNVAAPVPTLSAGEKDAAGNIGGNYFEHGYTSIMAGVSQADKVTFTRTGGV